MDETKLTAALPNLDIVVLHREDRERGAETITISVTATPSFEAVRAAIGPSLPLAALWMAPMQASFLAWSGLVRRAWAPWLPVLPAPAQPREPAGEP